MILRPEHCGLGDSTAPLPAAEAGEMQPHLADALTFTAGERVNVTHRWHWWYEGETRKVVSA